MLLTALTTSQLQVWIGLVGGLLTAIVGLLQYFKFRSRRDSLNAVGQAFANVIDSLGAQEEAKRVSGAILLRRFFDPRTEQGERHAPYAKEAVGVIAALLREADPGNFQKLLADGLSYAPSLTYADLQHCNLQNAYLGVRGDRIVNLSGADFFEADLSHASLRGARAREAVFYGATLHGTVFDDADLTAADFRGADLKGVRFGTAILADARFEGAENVPPHISAQLHDGRLRPAG